jgi:nitric oxide reductase
LLLSELLRYLTDLANKRIKEPKDDLVSQLVTEQVAKGNLELADAVQTAYLLLVAGNATMVSMIALVSVICLIFRDNGSGRLTDHRAL